MGDDAKLGGLDSDRSGKNASSSANGRDTASQQKGSSSSRAASRGDSQRMDAIAGDTQGRSARIANAFELLMRREEFSPYAPYAEILLRRVQRSQKRIETDAVKEFEEFSSARMRLREAWPSYRSDRRVRSSLSILVLVLYFSHSVIYIVRTLFPSFSQQIVLSGWPPFFSTPWNLLVALGAALMGSGLVYLLKSDRFHTVARDYGALSKDYLSTENQYNESLEVAVAGVLRRAIPAELSSTKHFNFSGRAPAMVELDSAKIAPATSIDYLRDFVASHESSAVGIAGSRGIGKSTALRAVTQASESTIGVYISAPVRYDPGEFLRRVIEEVAEQVLGDPPSSSGERLATPARRTAIFSLLITGTIAVFAGVMQARLAVNIPALAVLGAALIALGLILVVNEAMAANAEARLRRYQGGHGGVGRIAWEALQELRYRSETTLASSTAMKTLGGLLDVKDDATQRTTARDKSRAELVSALRRLLRDLHMSSDMRVVIAIDELDKMADSQDVIGVINDIKDLFHIRGVHFLVAVSTDALDRFALRGVPHRDAFDSSFDTIVLMQPMMAKESIEILRSRATGFPVPLGLFAHAWAGGLPRDLLRCARKCIEVYERLSEGRRSTDEVVRQTLRADLDQAISALARRIRDEVEDREAAETAVQALLAHVRGAPFESASTQLADLQLKLPQGSTREAANVLQRYLEIAAAVQSAWGTVAVPVGDWQRFEAEAEQLAKSDQVATQKWRVTDPAFMPVN